MARVRTNLPILAEPSNDHQSITSGKAGQLMNLEVHGLREVKKPIGESVLASGWGADEFYRRLGLNTVEIASDLPPLRKQPSD